MTIIVDKLNKWVEGRITAALIAARAAAREEREARARRAAEAAAEALQREADAAAEKSRRAAVRSEQIQRGAWVGELAKGKSLHDAATADELARYDSGLEAPCTADFALLAAHKQRYQRHVVLLRDARRLFRQGHTAEQIVSALGLPRHWVDSEIEYIKAAKQVPR